ncbi:RNA-splicing factor [Yamadazyma tenuis]|uniref:Pre-mRNA-splicing factor CWC21 n=1 Tax=Candida tenuis (strain ATCC 10573 / BCRC 21748 / CBS 615 / JCM 9827 / NBRC 10315 / NRRL Y-1498 / VKM Y-70) TaxID=590646 RepID=G3BDK6_CANTC|nr:uncharacterized protein CANTEDRAFT_136803 [Yamadazyma tenuis ATCC 10573]EGV60321.1 hypothetical protein CANTEDRAFT_136803 [Yamadazyma tenuis ATCC 10573]WEJ94440.1 RNA-splicing factor [Yamadazyma tenuis]
MSYKGIELKSTRGSGTSGYVTKNLASLGDKIAYEDSKERVRKVKNRRRCWSENNQMDSIKARFRNELESRESLRDIEKKCMELRDKLENEDMEAAIVDTKVKELRDKLMNQSEREDEIRSAKDKEASEGGIKKQNYMKELQIIAGK